LTTPERPLLEVGRITRIHGLRGEVVVDLHTDRLERVAPGSVLDTSRGPLVVATSRPFQGRHLVRFEGVDSREAAERIGGLALHAEAIDDPDALWVHDLIGTTVVEADGRERGRVASVEANPAHDMLVLDDGTLVPVVFVTSVLDGRTTVEVPEGIFPD
jgi:16S rRNA processing protein RimM